MRHTFSKYILFLHLLSFTHCQLFKRVVTLMPEATPEFFQAVFIVKCIQKGVVLHIMTIDVKIIIIIKCFQIDTCPV